MSEIDLQSRANLKRVIIDLPGTGRAPFSLPTAPTMHTLFVWGRRDALTDRPRHPRPNDVFISANHSAPMLAPRNITLGGAAVSQRRHIGYRAAAQETRTGTESKGLALPTVPVGDLSVNYAQARMVLATVRAALRFPAASSTAVLRPLCRLWVVRPHYPAGRSTRRL